MPGMAHAVEHLLFMGTKKRRNELKMRRKKNLRLCMELWTDSLSSSSILFS
ncbi:hypothetical protein M7I_4253 [Glarea lozoyensis 74030]|uniref:Peptidase M16 N-terminal domain-containing protein n=1 Tax=Glarea lozoyensis (strain ATCC 74030 / MF5533) TaxID=1104152 RepID=H0ENP2_GLAL7|nr:hypothetical protein M7I_4253 [Glarea lozoyensis 74030]